MKRVIVLGGLGQFGQTAAVQLRDLGVVPQVAARRPGAELRIDANDPASLRETLRPGDIVLDAAGPFQNRSTALIEAAMEIGFDVIDINDDLQYAEKLLKLQPRIETAAIRVLSSASSVSAVAAAIVQHSGIRVPRRVTIFLVPASRHTSSSGAALSLIRSVGRPVRVFHDGQAQERDGWSDPRRFRMPPPIGTICGRLFESADVAYLPRIWPTLREVAMYVDCNTPAANTVLRLAARRPAIRRWLERNVRVSTWIARKLGSPSGGLGYEIEDADGLIASYALVADKDSFVAAVAPAVLAARAIAEDRFTPRGLVLPDRHVEPAELFAFLESRRISICKV